MFKSIDGGKNWFLIEIEKPQSLSFDIYPNPTSDFININFNNFKNEIVKFEVYNLEGRLQNDSIIIDFENHSINITSLQQGMYLLVVHTVSGK
ncbi:MAG: T9SS type A sorting domain-containing protein, partial [Candidatus Kapabacteria bacterium]|nr:T9SS type A sorting domain-containing protein [Candidatus Kapabacteria bacterium]